VTPPSRLASPVVEGGVFGKADRPVPPSPDGTDRETAIARFVLESRRLQGGGRRITVQCVAEDEGSRGVHGIFHDGGELRKGLMGNSTAVSHPAHCGGT
jgi:hypothetical protein